MFCKTNFQWISYDITEGYFAGLNNEWPDWMQQLRVSFYLIFSSKSSENGYTASFIHTHTSEDKETVFTELQKS